MYSPQELAERLTIKTCFVSVRDKYVLCKECFQHLKYS